MQALLIKMFSCYIGIDRTTGINRRSGYQRYLASVKGMSWSSAKEGIRCTTTFMKLFNR